MADFKLTKYLERQKIIIRDDNEGGFQIPIPDEDTLSKLQATSVTYRFADTLLVLLSLKSDYRLMIMAM